MCQTDRQTDIPGYEDCSIVVVGTRIRCRQTESGYKEYSIVVVGTRIRHTYLCQTDRETYIHTWL